MNHKSSATSRKVSKPKRLGTGLSNAARRELLRIPSNGFVVVKPSGRELNPGELYMHVWALDRNVISVLESNRLVEPIYITGPFSYGYQLTEKGSRVVSTLLSYESMEPVYTRSKRRIKAPVTENASNAHHDDKDSAETREGRAA